MMMKISKAMMIAQRIEMMMKKISKAMMIAQRIAIRKISQLEFTSSDFMIVHGNGFVICGCVSTCHSHKSRINYFDFYFSLSVSLS